MSTILAIEGVDGVGKTTLCQQIQSHFGKDKCTIVSTPSKNLPIGKLIREEVHGREGRYSSPSNSGFFLLADQLHKAGILENSLLIYQLMQIYEYILLDRWIYSFYVYSRSNAFDYRTDNFFANSPFSLLSDIPVIYVIPPNKRILRERMKERLDPTVDDLSFDLIQKRNRKFLDVLNYLIPDSYIQVNSPICKRQFKDVMSFINMLET